MSIDSYIMTDKITNIDKYISSILDNVYITIDNTIYIAKMKIIGNYISATGFLAYYGKFYIFDSKGRDIYIPRKIRLKLSKKYIKIVRKRINKNYSISISDNYYSTITCKERLKCQ